MPAELRCCRGVLRRKRRYSSSRRRREAHSRLPRFFLAFHAVAGFRGMRKPSTEVGDHCSKSFVGAGVFVDRAVHLNLHFALHNVNNGLLSVTSCVTVRIGSSCQPSVDRWFGVCLFKVAVNMDAAKFHVKAGPPVEGHDDVLCGWHLADAGAVACRVVGVALLPVGWA